MFSFLSSNKVFNLHNMLITLVENSLYLSMQRVILSPYSLDCWSLFNLFFKESVHLLKLVLDLHVSCECFAGVIERSDSLLEQCKLTLPYTLADFIFNFLERFNACYCVEASIHLLHVLNICLLTKKIEET
jgi:hypothetical protein